MPRRRRPSEVAVARRAGTLARAHLCFAAMWAADTAFMVALSVAAFRDGGVAAVGVVTAVRMAGAAVLAPFLATLADRVRRELVLTTVGVVRAVTLGGLAVGTAAGWPAGATYGLAVVATVALALFRPAHSSLLPALVGSPAQLTRANAVRGMLDSVATLGGPVAATALLVVSGPTSVFAVCAGLSLLGGLVVVHLPYDAPPRATEPRGSVRADVVRGLTTIAREPGLRLVTGLGLAQTVTRGALTVLTVTLAVEVLGTGEAGVGLLSAATGAGAVVGSLGAFALVRRGGLAAWFGVGVSLFGVPLVVLAAAPGEVLAVLLLAAVGLGNALIDVSGFTLLARLTDERVLARMFAGFEAVLLLGVAAGGLVAPLAVHLLGTRGALAVVGLLAPAAVLACRPALRRLDAGMRVRDGDIELLRSVPMLGALPSTTVEQLAASLGRRELAPGEAVVVEGEPGDAFFVVESGRAEVVRHREVVRELGRGTGFGEVALLGDRPRTATVRAAPDAPLRVAVLGRGAFLTAVLGYPVSEAAGREAAAGAAERDRAREASAGGTSAGRGEPGAAPGAEVRQAAPDHRQGRAEPPGE